MTNTMVDITQEVKALNQQITYSLDKHIEEKELVQLINTFLQELKDKDRDIFLRRYWHMDSIAEISKRHGESESSIKSNLFRTRNKLKKELKKEGYLR